MFLLWFPFLGGSFVFLNVGPAILFFGFLMIAIIIVCRCAQKIIVMANEIVGFGGLNVFFCLSYLE
jgi:hypothetical protein